jgi:hypothetical protein
MERIDPPSHLCRLRVAARGTDRFSYASPARIYFNSSIIAEAVSLTLAARIALF